MTLVPYIYLGAFSKISPLAASHGLRIICVNRREYPGSSPFSAEELKVMNEGCNVERAKLLNEQGILLCLLLDRLIETLSLPKEGGITISSWSMGCIFAIAMLTAINNLPEDVGERLKGHVHKLLLWGTRIIPKTYHLKLILRCSTRVQILLQRQLELPTHLVPTSRSLIPLFPLRHVGRPSACGYRVTSNMGICLRTTSSSSTNVILIHQSKPRSLK